MSRLYLNYGQFQSTLSVRRATVLIFSPSDCQAISIHALREESDLDGVVKDYAVKISIHALREESDVMLETQGIEAVQFQSTLSVRRAT